MKSLWFWVEPQHLKYLFIAAMTAGSLFFSTSFGILLIENVCFLYLKLRFSIQPLNRIAFSSQSIYFQVMEKCKKCFHSINLMLEQRR